MCSDCRLSVHVVVVEEDILHLWCVLHCVTLARSPTRMVSHQHDGSPPVPVYMHGLEEQSKAERIMKGEAECEAKLVELTS